MGITATLAFQHRMDARDWAASQFGNGRVLAKWIESDAACIELKGDRRDYDNLPDKAPNGYDIRYTFRR